MVLQGDSLGDNEHCWWSVVSGCFLSALLFQPGLRVCTRSSPGTHQALKSEGALESSNLCLTTRAGLRMVISELTKGLGIENCLKQEREICWKDTGFFWNMRAARTVRQAHKEMESKGPGVISVSFCGFPFSPSPSLFHPLSLSLVSSSSFPLVFCLFPLPL